MKISGIKEYETKTILDVFNDFKNELKANSISKFTYDDFIYFVNNPENQNKYQLIAYKWHRDRVQLENEYYPCRALCVFDLFEAFSDRNKKTVVDDNGKKVKMINKIGEKLFEFVNVP